MSRNYRWEKCYERGEKTHWAIVDDESARKGAVTSYQLVVQYDWEKSLGTPFPECDLPQRIIALLNDDDGPFYWALTKMRRYGAPPNGEPFSKEGLEDLEKQLHEAARAGDSSLLEMAALTIRRLRSEDPANA